MRRLLLILILAFPFIHSTAAAPYESWWQKGNISYQNKQYDSAAIYYEKLAAHHLQNAEIYFNLGNTYYRLNQIGPAVLNYERALKLDPDNKQAKDNLALAQNRISNRIQETKDIFFVQWWNTMIRPDIAWVWAVISLALFLICLGILLAKRWNRLPAWIPAQTTGVLLFCFCIAIFISFAGAQKKASHDRAVIMQSDTPLKENAGSSKSQVLVPEGTVVKLGKEQSSWVEVRLPDGRTGWVHKDALEKI